MNPVTPTAAKPAPASGPPASLSSAGQARTAETRRSTSAVRGLVIVLGIFVAIVAMVMVYGQWVQPRDEPWRSAALTAARERLLQEPKNEALKTEIRELDRALRSSYFRGLERNRSGAWLLAVAGLGWVLAAHQWRRLTHRPAVGMPTALPPSREKYVQRAQWTVAAVGTMALLAFVITGQLGGIRLDRPTLPQGVAESGGETAAPSADASEPWPSPAQLVRNWPQFRGPEGGGRTASTNLPLSWDAETGSGVIWKVPVPLAGFNSPVVWEGRVFLTGGDRKERLVFCFAADTGELLWRRPVTPTNAPAQAMAPPDQSGQAASSVATDGERVFAVFATGELGALDFAGNLQWHRRLDFSEDTYGHASSLVVWQDRLLVQADQGQAEDGRSELLAFDTRTGKPWWATKRPVGGSWTTPVVATIAGRVQVITAGDPFLMAHDPAAGGELWRAEVLGGELAPSPVVASNLVLAICPGVSFTAIRADGSGVVTESHLVWRQEEEVPDVPTPVVAGDLVFSGSTEGKLVAREVATGEVVWIHEGDWEIQASPLLSGHRVYWFTQPGHVLVTEVAREYRELASFEMGEEIYASPAVAGDRLFVRTAGSLFCLGAPAGAETTKVADAR